MSTIAFFFEEIDPVRLNKKLLRESVRFIIQHEEKYAGDISVIFCSDQYLLKINEQYLNHDYYTDIVTFDYVENSVISGDLFISVDRVTENSKQMNVDFQEELHRVVFHGILHLLGYKDKTDAEKLLMRRKEEFYLREAGFKREKK